MSTIDIREGHQEEVARIRFSELQCIEVDAGAIAIQCNSSSSSHADVQYPDIPNLILALQKVLELKGMD